MAPNLNPEYMRNRSATTQTPAHLDRIEVGIILDGTHSHPDDFSVAVLRYAETLGWEIQPQDLVHVLIRELGMQDTLGQVYFENFGEFLGIASDEAVTWLNDNVTDEEHHFEIIESDLFLVKTENDDDDEPLGMTGYFPF